uniref:Fas activated serine/threonine kinase n=1 Tax=Sphenodon punctatus TaxID=8508 RepID=A0A8D0L4P5_SPHPU
MALIAKYVARHRLREPQLLDSIADFLLKRTEQLDSKLIQKLVFPFSRMNYRPSNHSELFPKLEAVLEQKGAASPLATVNILMSLFQLRHFPSDVLRQVFSPVFLATVTSSPHAQIVRRYLSLLDAAVALEFQAYSGPRLDPRYRVRMFDRALTADEANRKYSYKGLVAEALRQLVGEECYRQDEVLSPGYCTDFLLWMSRAGSVLPLSRAPSTSAQRPSVASLTSDMQNFSPFGVELGGSPYSSPPADFYKEPSLGSPASSTLSSTSDCSPCAAAATTTAAAPTRFHFPVRDTETELGPQAEEGQLASTPLNCPPASPCLHSPLKGESYDGPQGGEEIQRVVLSVNDKWHYSQNTDILVGSRAMRNRHLQMLGYWVVQLPYTELEKVSGIEEAKQYLCQKLRELRF